jgi:dTMP kinase
MLITFEGLDYSGKSTQIKLLAERLTTEKQRVLVLREPGGTPIGERIRAILLDKLSAAMTPVGEFLLFSASRTQLVETVVKPALEAGTIVICDRFYDSSAAYQGWGRGLSLDAIKTINQIATDGLVPDVTFFIDIPLDEVERRIRERKEGKDRMESSGRAFYERVQRGYLELATMEPRFCVINGTKSIEEIHALVWNMVEGKRHKPVLK